MQRRKPKHLNVFLEPGNRGLKPRTGMMADNAKQPSHDVFVVTNKEGKDAFWSKVGAAWATKSGDGLQLQLTSLPLDGRLTLLPFKPPKSNDETA